MKIITVNASTGVQWVKLGIRTFLRQPFSLLLIFVLCGLVIMPLSLLPLPFNMLASALAPLVMLVFMMASAQAMSGQTPSPARLFNILRNNSAQQKKALLMLGLAYAALYALCLGATLLVDDGTFAKMALGQIDASDQNILYDTLISMGEAEQFRFFYASMVFMLLLTLQTALFWHAPALVQWHRMGVGQSLYSSLLACLRNWRAFGVYFLCWMALTFALFIGLGIVVAILGALAGGLGTGGAAAGGMSAIAASSLAAIGTFVLSMMMITSVVFTFRDCFTPPDSA